MLILVKVRFKYKCTLKCSMTIKSLTITENAYDALKAMKHGDESFSEAILRLAKGRMNHIERHFGIMKLSEHDAEEWNKQIKYRRKGIDKEFYERQNKFKDIMGQHGSA